MKRDRYCSMDLLIAAVAGLCIESGLVAWAFASSQKLGERSPWFDVTQLPGGRIAELLFSSSGSMLKPLSCVILIQAALYCRQSSENVVF